MDGADFNNPFFGEQRGGQRPPFTFNLDAVQEVVVVADGAQAEFGRSSGGFVNVITKSGTNQLRGSVHGFFTNDSLSQHAEEPRRQHRRGGRASTAQQGGFTLGGPLVAGQALLLPGRRRAALAAAPSRPIPTAWTRGWSPSSPASACPTRTVRSSAPTTPRWRSPSSTGRPRRTTWSTFRYSYTNSEQVNGTFDVDQWGRSANGIEQDYSHAGTVTLISTLSSNLLNEVRAQYAKEWRPRPYEGPNIPGQNRPFPDTAILFNNDFTPNGARWGMPFFLPVEYDDDRKQLTENVSYLRGNHSFKAGVEYNEVASSQTFIGFANGRFVFLTTNDFINYVQQRRRAGRRSCSTCSRRASATPSVEEAGTQTIEQKEPAIYVQDQWRARGNLTIDYGLRWEALDNPDVRTPPSEVFFAPFIGADPQRPGVPLRRRDPRRLRDVAAAAGHLLGAGRGRQVGGARHRRHLPRPPAGAQPRLDALDQRQPRPDPLPQHRADAGCLGPPPPYTPAPASGGAVFFPDVFVYDKDWQTPRTTSLQPLLRARGDARAGGADQAQLRQDRPHHPLHQPQRPPPRLALVERPAAGRRQRHHHADHRRVDGEEPLPTASPSASTSGCRGNYAYQIYYTWSKDKSDDDNERDPFTFRYADITQLDREFSYSDRDQRHRVNAWAALPAALARPRPQPALRLPLGAAEVDHRHRRRRRRRPAARINPDGSVTRRNLGRKDNEFIFPRPAAVADFAWGGVTVQPVFEVFNVFDEENFLRPQTTELAFNFDGTVRSGAGDPRIIQLGLKVLF